MRQRNPSELKTPANSRPQQELADPDALYEQALRLVAPAFKHRSSRNLRQARTLLLQMIQVRPKHAAAHALLGYMELEAKRVKFALPELRKAAALDPENQTYSSFLLEVLDAHGLVGELKKKMSRAATVSNIDLASIRKALRRAGLPSDPSTVRLNAFPAGRRHYESDLLDAVEALRGSDPMEPAYEAEEAFASRRAVRIDGRKVPATLRMAIGLARRWGIPDDVHRSWLTAQMTARERKELKRTLSIGLRRRINAWLDTFTPPSSMSGEAVHFMYLLEVFDEIFAQREGSLFTEPAMPPRRDTSPA
jgi:tetratricopeptide (TPR) repeat protein